jgi:hypothetical protein
MESTDRKYGLGHFKAVLSSQLEYVSRDEMTAIWIESKSPKDEYLNLVFFNENVYNNLQMSNQHKLIRYLLTKHVLALAPSKTCFNANL